MQKLLMTSILALGIVVVPAAMAQGVKASSSGALEIGNVSVRTLAKGLTFDATFKKQISSQKDRVGDIITGVIVADVKDDSGVVIFPANALASVQIMDIMGADKYHADGSLVLLVRSVNVGSRTFRMRASPDSAARGVYASDTEWTRRPVKMEMPGSNPSLEGLVGRAPKGTVVGTHLVVSPGTSVRFELAEAVTVTN